MVSVLKLGFLNIYASKSGGARKEFWFKIGSDLLSVDHLCMLGYFNMIEDFGDKAGGSHALISSSKLSASSYLNNLSIKVIKRETKRRSFYFCRSTNVYIPQKLEA